MLRRGLPLVAVHTAAFSHNYPTASGQMTCMGGASIKTLSPAPLACRTLVTALDSGSVTTTTARCRPCACTATRTALQRRASAVHHWRVYFSCAVTTVYYLSAARCHALTRSAFYLHDAVDTALTAEHRTCGYELRCPTLRLSTASLPY